MRRGINLGSVLLLVAGAGLFLRCLPPRGEGRPSPQARTMDLVSGLQKAIMQYHLDHGVLPTLTPGRVMTDEEGMTCLFQALRGPPVYFNFEDREVVGGLAGVAGEGARPVEAGLPVGAIVDAWGRGLRYREYRSVPAAARPPGIPDTLLYELYSLGEDGVARTDDDTSRYDPSRFQRRHLLSREPARRLGLLAATLMMAGAIAWMVRRRRIGRWYDRPVSSES